MIDNNHHPECNTPDAIARQYRRLYAVCFSIFLVITLMERVLPQRWRSQKTNLANGTTAIQQAKEQAGTFVPSLFMNF